MILGHMKRLLLVFVTYIMAFTGAIYAQDSTQVSIFSVVEVLDEAVMTAQKSRVVYKLDRQKVGGSSNLSASGGKI